VYAFLQRSGEVQAAHPSHDGPTGDPGAAAGSGEHLGIAVGTAHLEADGSYLINLNALPINGQLVFRPSGVGYGAPNDEEAS
jgi:hypothetical protein